MRSKRCSCGRDSAVSVLAVVGTSNKSPRVRANSEATRLCAICLEDAREALAALPGRSGGARLLRASVHTSRKLLKDLETAPCAS